MSKNMIPHPTVIPDNIDDMTKEQLIERIKDCDKLFMLYWEMLMMNKSTKWRGEM